MRNIYGSCVCLSLVIIATVALSPPATVNASSQQKEKLEMLVFENGLANRTFSVDGVEYRSAGYFQHPVATAWLDIGSYKLRDRQQRSQPGKLYFQLRAKDGTIFPVSAFHTYEKQERGLAYLCFKESTSNKFEEPDLVALVDDEEIARWPLPNFPVSKRVIPADEPNFLKVDNVLGLSIEVSATKRLSLPPSEMSTGSIMFWLDVKGEFSPYREYWVYYGVTETTWYKPRYSGGMGGLFEKPRKPGIGTGELYALSAERLRIEGRVDQYDVYGEEAVFKNLKFVRNDITGTLYLVNDETQEVKLSTGVTVIMHSFAEPVKSIVNTRVRGERLILRFPIVFPHKVRNLTLPPAPGKLSSTEDVTLWIGKYSVGTDRIGQGGRMIKATRSLALQVLPETVWSGKSFDITVEVKHSAKVATEPISFLVPIEEQEPNRFSGTP